MGEQYGETARPANLGEILLITGKVTAEQLNEVLDIQQNQEEGKRERLGLLLLRKKYLTEEDIYTALSLQLSIPFFKELDTSRLNLDLVKKLPINFAKKFKILPLWEQDGELLVAVDNPLDPSPLEDLRMLLDLEVRPVLAMSTTIIDAINKIYDRVTNTEQVMDQLDGDEVGIDLDESQDLIEADDEAPIIRLVNTMMYRAVKEGASDIHIDPFEKESRVRFRIDGVLHEVLQPPKRYHNSLASRIKIMAKLNIAEKRLPQDGRIKIKIAGKDIDIRLSTLPTPHGERVVMRLLDKSNVVRTLDQLGFGDHVLVKLRENITKPHGVLIVCGPTGSGKTTSLYACLNAIYSPEKNILTVEDPVEYQLDGIGQIAVNAKINLTFANVLRSILRQDPDVIMIGEIRDPETAEIAIQASLTGHFVFSTVHTNDSYGVVTRLVDMGIEPFLIASSLVGVLAQRLIRTLCPNCKREYEPDNAELAILNINRKDLIGGNLWKAVGCPQCQGLGYKGRMGIHEFLPIDDDLRTVILKGSDSVILKRVAVSRGMKTLREDGAMKVVKGFSTIEEVLKVTQVDSTIE
ncbi:MAG: type II secretion system protein GspE [Deltaproteobacteria bacterium RIFOXYA12_FULL_61_11]|nr:MAG: type II secretion system protein GspE [Deltaproteobacteria bacterium RIFOXYA12_FULL_61_11]